MLGIRTSDVFLEVWHVNCLALVELALSAGHCHRVVVGSVALAGDVVTAATVVGSLGGGWVVVWVAVESEFNGALPATSCKSGASEADDGSDSEGLHCE